jgi:hypothetical protein
VAIREVFSSAENASRISFPGHHRSAETKERAYVRGTFFRDGGPDEIEDAEEVEEETPAAEEVLEEAEVTEEPLAVDTEDDDDSEDDAEE